MFLSGDNSLLAFVMVDRIIGFVVECNLTTGGDSPSKS